MLELSGAAYSGAGRIVDQKAYGIYAEGDWTFVLSGDNSIELTGDEIRESYGIYVTGKLNIVNAKDDGADAAGSLNVTAGAATYFNAGIYADEVILTKEDSSAVSVTATGGSLTNSADEGSRPGSCGIWAVNGYKQAGGTVTAKGGAVRKTGADGNVIDSFGIRCAETAVSGGSLTVEGGTGLIESGGYITGIGLYQADAGKTSVFENCTLTALSGDGWSSNAYCCTGILCKGTVTVGKDAKITATGSVTTDQYATGFDAKALRLEGGEIHAEAKGARVKNDAIYVNETLTITTGSNAVVEAEAGAPTLTTTGVADNWSQGISASKIIIEKETGAIVRTSAESTDQGVSHAYGINTSSPGSVIESGEITATATAGNGSYGNTMGIYFFRGGDIKGGKLVCTANGINFLSAGIGCGGGDGITVSGGEVTAVADLKGQTAKLKAEYPNQCFACGIYTESGYNYSVNGGKLIARGSDMAVFNYGGVYQFEGSVLYASESFDGSDEVLLPVSAYDVHRLNNRLAAYKYIRSESGSVEAPACEDIDMVQRYIKTDLSVDLSDTLPGDAGIVRYLTNTVDETNSGRYLPVITDEYGDPSENTTVSDISIDQETGILTAKITASAESAGDIITFPVSVRSTKYKTVLRNVTVTLSDKDGGYLTDVSQESITYGGALPAPVYTKPDEEGVESFRYSGTLDDGTDYPLSATAPDQAGHYMVRVTYETEDTRYIGKSDFVISPRDISDAVVTLGEQAEYDGTEKNVVIESVKAGVFTLTRDVDYEITSGGTVTEIENTVATITAKGNNFTGTKSFTWHLKKLIPQLSDFTLPSMESMKFDYTGSPIAAPLPVPKAGVTGMGEVTLKYTKEGEATTTAAPTAPGTYRVTFDVAEGSRYTSAEGFSYGANTLRIQKLSYPGVKRLTHYVPSNDQHYESIHLPEIPDGATISFSRINGTGLLNQSYHNVANGIIYTEVYSAANNTKNTIELTVSETDIYNGYTVYIDVVASSKTSIDDMSIGGNTGLTYGDSSTLNVFGYHTYDEDETFSWTKTDAGGCISFTGETNARGVSIKAEKPGDAIVTANFSSKNYIGSRVVKVHVDKKALTVTVPEITKTYDGTLAVTIADGTLIGIEGVLEDDADKVSADMGVSHFSDKNAGMNKTVTFDGISLTGDKAGNYFISEVNAVGGTITPKEVTAGVSATDRAYVKGNTEVALKAGNVTGVIIGDDVAVNVTNARASVASDSAGGNKAVTVSGVKLSGADAGNYVLSAQPTGVKVNIQKALWQDTAAAAVGVAGVATQAELSAYLAPGGSFGAANVASGGELFATIPTMSGTKLDYRFKNGASEGQLSVISIPVTGAANYHDYELTVNLLANHHHRIEAVEAKAATCTEAGNIAYYRCSICGELYSDEAGANVITASSTVTAALGHLFGEWVVTKEATTEEAGIKTRTCSRCGVTETDTIPKLAEEPQNEPVHQHKLVHHARVEATEEAEGSIEYWECSECKKLYADEAATKEITAADIVIPKLIPPTKTPVTPDPVKVTETIGDIPVTIETSVIYPKAVTWTGSKITKDQLAALAADGEIAKVTISGLNEAIKTMKPGTDVSKLYKISYSIGKEKEVSSGKAYFTVKISLKGSALKKAGIKGNDKKALQQLVKKLNEQLKNTKYTFDIVPIRLKDAESVTVKARLKGGQLQVNEDGSLAGLKSVKIKVQIAGVKKAKTFSFTAKKASKEFGIKVADAAAGTVDITATGTHFEGSRTGIKATK